MSHPVSLPDALLEAAPTRVPQLLKHGHGDAQVLKLLAGQSAADLFPQARAPQAALAGLYFYFGCWEKAHETAQEDDSAEGSYWHGILHRQEPDNFNAKYWLRLVEHHPVLGQLVSQFGHWNHADFVDFCQNAKPGTDQEKLALERQLAEWQLLYRYCKEPA